MSGTSPVLKSSPRVRATALLSEKMFGRTALAKPGAAGAMLLSAMVLATSPLFAAELRCPPRLPGQHAGFAQSGPIPSAHWLLWRMRLFDGRPDNGTRKEFTPDSTIERRDGVTLVWRFTLDEDLLMVCIYDGSGTYYYARRQAPPGRCVLDDDNGLTRAWCD
jgi:hypothetical protein